MVKKNPAHKKQERVYLCSFRPSNSAISTSSDCQAYALAVRYSGVFDIPEFVLGEFFGGRED